MNKGYVDFSANLNYNEFNFEQEDVQEDVYYTSDVFEREYVFKTTLFNQLSKQVSISNGLTYKFLNNQNITSFADSIYNRSGNKVAKDLFTSTCNVPVSLNHWKHRKWVSNPALLV